ncbi:MAG: ectonucleotide pyrophosphatase/phosphodiesterase [Candidatus Kapaibacterium sp.]
MMRKTYLFIAILLLSSLTAFKLESKDNEQIVILVSLDGFRWDYPDRGYSPKLKEIEEQGVRALTLQPQFPSMTFPNHYSIITGLVPEKHGIIANYFLNPITGDTFSLRHAHVSQSKWYKGEAFWETARRYGIKTAAYFWPGSEMDLEYRRPDYFESYEHERPYRTRVAGVIEWLKLPDSLMPRFIMLYFDETDSKAHSYGTDSKELNQGITRVDSMIALLDSGIKDLGLSERVNLIILSDHGMADISSERIINLNDLIGNNSKPSVYNYSTMAMIDTHKDSVGILYSRLKNNENRFKVYKKDEITERYRYKNHPYLPEILLIADNGWQFVQNNQTSKDRLAAHGYDNKVLDMQGIFFAKGPAFKKNYKCNTLNNIDIYPLLCKLFDIEPLNNIDGNLLNIIHVLEE